MATSTGIRLLILNSIVERLMPLTTDAPLLANGEFGLEAETGKLKLGDGSTSWANLPYFTGGTAGPATQIRETGGPTTLNIASIPDGDFLKRSGTTVVGASIGGGPQTGTATTTDNTTPKTAATIALSPNTNYRIILSWLGRQTTATVGAVGGIFAAEFTVTAKRIGGGAVVVDFSSGSNQISELNTNPTLAAVASGNNVLLQVTGGDAATTVLWLVTYTVESL